MPPNSNIFQPGPLGWMSLSTEYLRMPRSCSLVLGRSEAQLLSEVSPLSANVRIDSAKETADENTTDGSSNPNNGGSWFTGILVVIISDAVVGLSLFGALVGILIVKYRNRARRRAIFNIATASYPMTVDTNGGGDDADRPYGASQSWVLQRRIQSPI